MNKKITVPILDMFFRRDHGRKIIHRIVYIEYVDGLPFSVTTDVNGIQNHFDFEMDCKGVNLFMFREVGSGGKITEIQAPNFVKTEPMASYWLHADAQFESGGKPLNATRLSDPIELTCEINGTKHSNPFNLGREILGSDYCKFCSKWYDEDACPDHHVVIDGELRYYDGSPCEN